MKRILSILLALLLVFPGMATVSAEGDLPESPHPYPNNLEESYVIYREGAERIAITFSEESHTEGGCDCLDVYNGNGEYVVSFSGSFGGERVVLDGDTVTLVFITDEGITDYGFAVEKVEVFYEECFHSNTEYVGAYEATCVSDGYTGDLLCSDCGVLLGIGLGLVATPHNIGEGDVCVDCGIMLWEYSICDGEATLNRYNGTDTKVTVPETLGGYPVTVIGMDAFVDVDTMEELVLPQGLKAILDYAFYDCSFLRKIVVPEGVESLGEEAFRYCLRLKEITLPVSLVTIDGSSFEGCNSLEKVNYLGTKEQWERIEIKEGNDCLLNALLEVHYGQHDYTDVCDGDCSLCGYHRKAPHSYVDGVCELCGTEVVAESPHPYPNNLEESYVIYREGAERIAITFNMDSETEQDYDFLRVYDGEGNLVKEYTGFFGGERLVVAGDTVTLVFITDESVTDYGFAVEKVEVFYDKCAHTNTRWQNRVEEDCENGGYTGDLLCADCQLVLQWGETTDSLGHDFADGNNCSRCEIPLWEYEIDDGRVRINAYNGDESHLMVPSTLEGGVVTAIGMHAFSHNYALESIVLPEGVTRIEAYAFYDCVNLSKVTLPESIFSIGNEAFCNCDALTEIVFPENLSLLGSDIFFECDSLAAIWYCGTEEQWDEMEIGMENDVLRAAELIFFRLGDADGDGTVSFSDIQRIYQHLSSVTRMSDGAILWADANKDGNVNFSDIQRIYKHLSEGAPLA